MNIERAIREAFNRAQARNNDYLVVLVDIHDTIFEACWHNEENFKYFPYAKETLQEMSKRDDIKIVLWSSTYPQDLDMYLDKLLDDNIIVDYVNENPYDGNTDLACFDKKFYFSFGIDNAFGFEPETDWKIIYNTLNNFKL